MSMNVGMVEAPANSETTSEEMEVVLRCLALNSGKVRKTARELGMAPSTISEWRRDHKARYDTIVTEVIPTVHARIAEKCEALADTYAALEAETAHQLAEALKAKDIPARDLPATSRNLATSKAINVDKAQLIRGQPRRDQERRDALQLLRALAVRFPAVVEAEAVEIHTPPSLPQSLSPRTDTNQ